MARARAKTQTQAQYLKKKRGVKRPPKGKALPHEWIINTTGYTYGGNTYPVCNADANKEGKYFLNCKNHEPRALASIIVLSCLLYPPCNNVDTAIILCTSSTSSSVTAFVLPPPSFLINLTLYLFSPVLGSFLYSFHLPILS